MENSVDRTYRLPALRIVAIYAGVAGIWIYLSDTALGFIVPDPAIIVRISVLKGFIFIIITAALLYKLISRHIRKSQGNIVELRRRERELEEKNSELERFTYMVSHDLKSPLVTVHTFLGYLEQDMARSDAGRVEKDISYIRCAADRMGQLLDDLLEFSRIGRISNPPMRVTFRELAESAICMVAGSISERGVEIRINDMPVILYGDRLRLVEIWQNLLENAVKFMGAQTAPLIEIGAEQCGRDTVFYVRDNGVGIDPRYQAKVFGLFEKLDRQSDGTGLGLALIKRIVHLYQGTISVQSEGQGQGTCFRFTLPGACKNSPEVE